MAESIGDVIGKLSLDTSAFSRALQTAQGQLQSSTTRMAGQMGTLGKAAEQTGTIFGRFGVATSQSVAGLGRATAAVNVLHASLVGLAASAAAGFFARLVKDAADVGDELNRLSIQTGITVEDLSALRVAAKLNDTTISELARTIGFLNQSMAAARQAPGDVRDAYVALGISLSDLANLSGRPLDAFVLIAQRLTEVENISNRNVIAQRIMSRGWREMAPILDDLASRGIKAVRDESDRLNQTWSRESAKAADDFNDAMDRVKLSASGLAAHLTKFVIGPMTAFFDSLRIRFGGATALEKAAGDAAALQDQLVPLNRELKLLENQQSKLPPSMQGANQDRINAIIAQMQALNDKALQAEKSIARVLEAPGKVGTSPELEPPPPPKTVRTGNLPEALGRGDQSAAAVAAAQTKLVEARLAVEEAGLEKEQAIRAAALEEEYQTALRTTVKTKADQERVEREFTQRRLEDAKQAALESIDFEIEASKKIEAAKLAAAQVGITAARQRQAQGIDTGAESTGKITELEAEITTIKAEAEAKRIALAAKRADAEKAFAEGTTASLKDELSKQLAAQVHVQELAEAADQRRLQARIDVSDAQISLVEAETQGEILSGKNSVEAKQQAYEKIKAIQAQRLVDSRALYQSEADASIAKIQREVQDETDAAAQISDVKERLAQRLSALEVQGAVERQTLLNQQLQEYKAFSDRVTESLTNVWRQALDHGLDVIKTLRDVALDTIAQILAELTRPIVVPIAAQFIGALGGVIPGIFGGLGEAAAAASGTGSSGSGIGTGELLGLAGIARQLSGVMGPEGLGGTVDWLRQMMTNAGGAIQQWFGIGGTLPNVFTTFEGSLDSLATITEQSAQEMLSSTGALTTGMSTFMSVAGGLGFVGGGIYGALNARNNLAKGAYAASAAAGAFTAAAASGLLVAAGATAATTGWTGYGLIAAAVLAAIGFIADKFISPAGPSLAVGHVGGGGIEAVNRRLQVAGDVSSQVLRHEGVSRGMVSTVQSQLSGGIRDAVTSILDVINAVALNPEALIGPTRDALNTVLAAIRPINSANAKKMEKDISEQLRFVNAQVAAGLLEPVAQAFDQLRDTGTLQEKLTRFPGTIAGLTQLFQGMNKQLDEIAGSGNTDVLRQLSAVRNQVENFGNRIAGTAGQLAEGIVTGMIDKSREAVDKVMQQSLEIQALTVPGAFAERMVAARGLQQGAQTLESVGLDAHAIFTQLDRLFASVITDAFAVIRHALDAGPFDKALNVILAIPDAVIALNPLLAAYRAIAQAFAPLVGQLTQDVAGFKNEMTPLTQRIAEGQARMLELGQSIQDAGTEIGVALPLYDALRQQIIANAQLQIQALQEIAQAWQATMDQVDQDISGLEDILLPVGERLNRSLTEAAAAFAKFQAALSAGETLKAIEALKEYERLIVEAADLRIKALQDERQAVIDAWQAVIDGTQAQIDAWQDAMKVQQQFIDALDVIGTQWQDAIKALEGQAQAWQDFITALDGQKQAWQETITALEGQAQAWKTFIDQIDQAIASLTTLGERVHGLIVGQASPNAQVADIRLQIAAAQAALATATTPEARVAGLQRLADLNQALLQIGEQTNQLALIQEALNNLSVLQGQIASALTDLGLQKTVAQLQLDSLNTQIAYAKAQIDALDTLIVYAKLQIDSINAQIVYAKAQYDAVQAQIIYARAQLDAMNAQVEQLNALLDAQQKALAAVEKSTYWDEQIAAVQTEALSELMRIKAALTAIQGDQTWENQVLAVQQSALVELQAMQSSLAALYRAAVGGADAQSLGANAQAQTVQLLTVLRDNNLKLPLEVHVGNFFESPHQRGGFVGLQGGGMAYASLNRAMSAPLAFASGGLVPLMAEPGERLFTPPVPSWVPSLNQAIPRFSGGGFSIPGRGSGDTVPILAPAGSFVLNRTAVHAAGLQEGGSVATMGGDGGDTYYVQNVNGPVFRESLTLEDLKRLWRTLERQSMSRSHG